MSVFDELQTIVLPKMGGKKKSMKKKLLDSIQREIDTIKVRENCEKDSGDRFWNYHPTQSDKVVLYLKVRKIIFKFGSDIKKYWVVDRNINSIVEKLKEIYDEIDILEENNQIFNEVSNSN